MSAKAKSTRDELCEAAIRTASRDGLLAMTLDNVAREAGVSKGGVMYHFPTKDDLVRAMLEYFGAKLEGSMLRQIADDPHPHGRWGRALLNLISPETKPPGRTREVGSAATAPTGTDAQPSGAQSELLRPEALEKFLLSTLAAAVNNPELIEPLRTTARRMQQRFLAESGGEVDQLLVWLIVDGLLLWQFIGLIDRGDPLFRKICEDLHRRLEGTPSLAIETQPPAPHARKTTTTRQRKLAKKRALARKERS